MRPPSRARLLAPAFSRPPSRARLLAPAFSRLNNILLLVLALACHGLAAPAPPVPWDSNSQGGFVTALCGDRQGHIWVAAEDDGVWEFAPYAPVGRQWTQFTAENTGGGLGDDDCYSLACDRLGRVWAGTGRDGVSVFNGRQWKTYDRLTGPLGCHVTALAVSPRDGSIWMGSELGLARYQDGQGWRYWTRADGLPSDQTDCLAFARDGTLYAGTDCDGLAIASPGDGYTHWRHVPGPSTLPDTPGGDGLPSALVNCLLVARDGTIYAGTDAGLAHSQDNGHTWRFLRGADWKDKLAGLYQPVAPRDVDTGGLLLSEDYVTALAEDGEGHLLVGHRQKGIGVYSEATARGVASPGAYGGYVDALLPTRDGKVLIGSYGDGLQQIVAQSPITTHSPPSAAAKPPAVLPPLPAPALPPSIAALQTMLKKSRSLHGTLPVGEAAYLGEDWQTQGDWMGRYGRQYALLCAMQSPWGDHLPVSSPGFTVTSKIGPHHDGNDSLRSWVQWVQTDLPKSLYDPEIGYHRQAEHDDHGEGYPLAHEGPDIWYTVTVPSGIHRVSLYFMNKDGHAGDNRLRDYTVEVKSYDADLDAANSEPALACARVQHFWGGVYQRFIVSGPDTFYIKVSKGYSLNTLCSGVFIDRLTGTSEGEADMQTVWLGTVHYDPPDPGALPYTPTITTARALWDTLDAVYEQPRAVAYENSYRLLAYRSLVREPDAQNLLDEWRWSLNLWTGTDRKDFDEVMAQGRKSLLATDPQVASLHN